MEFEKNILLFISLLCFCTTVYAQTWQPGLPDYRGSECRVKTDGDVVITLNALPFKARLRANESFYAGARDCDVSIASNGEHPALYDGAEGFILSGDCKGCNGQGLPQKKEIRSTDSGLSAHATCEKPRYNNIFHYPYGLKGYFDLEQALACARVRNKPLLISFTSRNCLDCQEMEVQVWSDKEVLKHLKEDYVLVTLYVDEKVWMPTEEWYFSNLTNQVIKTVGGKNADYQLTKFDKNTLPLYVLTDADEQLLASPRAYDPDVKGFIEFLLEGHRRFSQLVISKGP